MVYYFMAVDVKTVKQDGIVILEVEGRLDTYGATEFARSHPVTKDADVRCAVLDLSKVGYLSSAAIRELLIIFQVMKKKGGLLVLAAVARYCRDVLDMSGLSGRFPVFDTGQEAMEYCTGWMKEHEDQAGSSSCESVQTGCGSFTMIAGDEGRVVLEVVGHVNKVLYARITDKDVCSKRFSQTEYSIGLGGLGARLEDFFGIMGEMMTIGGTMVWLPTDGHDMPDFLVPKADTGAVTVRTVFNAAITGGFNEYVIFESSRPEGVRVSELYEALLELAVKRRPGFSGFVGIAMRAQMAAVYGSGVKKSTIADFAPPNREMIIHPDNSKEWFALDTEPRHRKVTALVCGIGALLPLVYGHFDREDLDSVFYLHPANRGSTTQLLHNHGVIFSEIPLPGRFANMEEAIRPVVDSGDFLDMRHLLDNSTITKAFLGIGYIQGFLRSEGDAAG